MTARLPRDRQRGIALLLVLWAFMILGVLALDFSRYMRDDAMAAVNFADETQGYYVALAGMHKALWQAKVAREENPATGMRDGSAQDPKSKQQRRRRAGRRGGAQGGRPVAQGHVPRRASTRSASPTRAAASRSTAPTSRC